MTGDLIFTTKGRYSNSGAIVAWVLSFVALCLSFPLWVIFMFPFLICYVIAFISLLISMIFALTASNKMKNSFIEIYADYVIGVSTNGQTFRLRYNEIVHLEKKENMVNVFFQGGKYEVQAKGVEKQVIALIEQQKLKSK